MNTIRKEQLSALGIGLVALTAACAGGASGDASRWEASIDTVGDTVIVRTLSGGEWETEMELVPELSIGVLEGDEAYMLGSVQGLAVSASGEIYVLDRQVPVIRRYSATGEHLMDIGRSGGGPGEYKQPDGGLLVLEDGRVLLRDPGNARINVYGQDGSVLGEWPLPSGGGFSSSRKLYRDPSGNVYTMVLLERYSDVTQWRYGLAQIGPDGTVRDTLPAPEWDFERPVISARNENSSSSSNVPFSGNVSWTFSPLGYFVGGLSTDYRLELFGPAEKRRRIEKVYEPVPVSAAEKAEAEQRITYNFQQSFPGWRWNGPPVPDVKAPYRSLHAGEDGRIWVLLSQPADEVISELEAKQQAEEHRGLPPRFIERIAFDVFEPDGRYLGRVHAPRGFSTGPEPVFRGDRVWAVQRDSLDVASVVRFRLSPRSE